MTVCRRAASRALRSFILGLLCLPLACAVTGQALAGEVKVAVAANFTAPMKRIAEAFERATGHRVVAAYASTGKLYAQIAQGAPFEVLLSADARTPARLETEGRAVAGTRFTYATGRLALWSREEGVVDAAGDVLRQGAVARLAIADPKLAPYGAAAVQVLQRLGLQARLQPRLVTGESIAQAWQFVATGNAAMGFVALSQVMQDGRLTRGSAWVVPSDLHDPILQDAVLLKAGQDREAALALMRFLRSQEARRLIREAGYEP
ncbi:MAG: molybdate ABC transporter substrate-binding protein [Rubrivivax sp.]